MRSKLTLTAVSVAAVFIFSNFLLAQSPTPAALRQQSLTAKSVLQRNSPFATKFRNVGPNVMSGRVVDLDVNPADATEFYVAYATGGLWHTTNNGLSFSPIFDSAEVIGLGDVTVHWPSRTIWLGTGEANSSRSSYSGLGVYKSQNNGATWQYLGLPESHHIGEIVLHPTDPNTAWVAVLGHLYSANKERGVYKTTDGGSTWKQTLYVDDNTGAIEMDINPQNPNELYAAMWYRTRRAWNFDEGGSTSGIYKSTDGGSTWQLITTPGSGFPQGNGIGRMGVAIAATNPNTVYVVLDNQARLPDTARKKTDSLTYSKAELKDLTKTQFEQLNDKRLDTFLRRNRLTPKYSAAILKRKVAADSLQPTALYDYLYDANDDLINGPITGCQVYRSDDGGKNWRKTHDKNIATYNTYGYYFGRIFVSPSNADKVVLTGFTVEMSTDGGKTFKSIGKNNTHADHHVAWLNPQRDSHMIIGNDGGVNLTYDDGKVWFKANTPAVGQFYAITTDNARPYRVYGGLQDNGVWYGYTTRQRTSDASYDTLAYKAIGGGDGMMVQVDTRDNKTVYSGSQFGFYGRTHLDTGGAIGIRPANEIGEAPYRYNWMTPIVLSRHNQDVFYMGSNKLHRSMNKGAEMKMLGPDLTNGKKEGDVPFGTITTLSESTLRFGLLYAGTDDGNIQMSKDGGYTWTKISNSLKTNGLWVSRVLASQYQEGRVYATLNGYRNDHFNAYVYVSNDYGNTWLSIANNLPLEPVNVIREDPKNDSILYLGTDGGLYVSKNYGRYWNAWQQGLPKSVPVHDIAVQERENEILLGTHGRSIYVAKLFEIQGLPAPKERTVRRPTSDDDDAPATID